MWPKESKLEGRAEVYLRWPNLGMITIAIVSPLVVSLFFGSYWIKIICWIFSLMAYVSYLQVQGPCVQAVAIGLLPWYVYFEWRAAPKWLMVVATLILLIEISYIRHRMRIIRDIREKEGILP